MVRLCNPDQSVVLLRALDTRAHVICLPIYYQGRRIRYLTLIGSWLRCCLFLSCCPTFSLAFHSYLLSSTINQTFIAFIYQLATYNAFISSLAFYISFIFIAKTCVRIHLGALKMHLFLISPTTIFILILIIFPSKFII